MPDTTALPVGAANESRLRERWVLRVLGLLGLAIIGLTFPAVGPGRVWFSALLVALTPVPVLLPRLLPPRFWLISQSAFDVVTTVAVIGLAPKAWTAALVIVTCSPAASAALLGRRVYIGLEAFGLVGMGVAAHVSGVDNWEVPLAVSALLLPLVASFVDVFLAQEVTAATQLDDVAESSAAVFWEADAETGAFLAVSGRVADVFGRASGERLVDLPSLLVDEDRERWWDRVRNGEDDRFVLECRSLREDGSVVWLRLHVRRQERRGGRVLRGIAFDVTELAEAHDEVRRRAETDHLTGLPNRFVLVRGLEQRCGAGTPFALFIIDLDRFKDINDTLGHHAGDQFLRAVAGRLTDVIGAEGLVARMGGDEFAVVMDDPPGLDAVQSAAARLVEACEGVVEIAELEVAGAASCGVAVAPAHGDNAEDLLRRADLAMYAAKRAGTRFGVFDHSSDDAKLSRLRLSAEAEAALATGQIRLWFQPKVDLATGDVVGAEGLLRWHHPERGVLLPADFLDIVELSRHRRALSEAVVGQGVDFLVRTELAGRPVPLAVNVSLRDLVDPEFAPMVVSRLADSGVPSAQLTLEVTERDLMDDRSGFLLAAAAVRATGVSLSIDDFGTGHSSLLRLHQLPVTELKIDRSFVAGLESDPHAAIIVRSIVELGRALGHSVVAEGIETSEEVALLRSLGCETGQGYLYSAALPLEDFLSMLDEGGALHASALRGRSGDS